jgi:hypothetical protein
MSGFPKYACGALLAGGTNGSPVSVLAAQDQSGSQTLPGPGPGRDGGPPGYRHRTPAMKGRPSEPQPGFHVATGNLEVMPPSGLA